MQIKIYGQSPDKEMLLEKVNFAIDELGLNDYISSELTEDQSLKKELNISKNPALIIEEETIDFKDMIFEGFIPEIEELKSMFISVVGSGEGSGCSSGGCSGCTGCG